MNDKLIVVVGAGGRLGRLIVQSLLAQPSVRVRALVRDPKKPEAAGLAADRVELRAFDAASASDAERAEAVKGAFAVVSTLQGGPDIIIDAQLSLARAAKAAKVRRFISSAFSYDLFALPEGVNINTDWRRTFAQRAKSEVADGIEVVHVMQGIFTDKFVLGFLGLLDASKGVLRYWGDGKTPIDWTSWEDTARFTAAAALDDRVVPERLYVAGDRLDVHGFAKAYESVRGTKLALESLGSLDDLRAEVTRKLSAEPSNMYAWLPLMYARGVFEGQALLGPTLNARYPEIAAETVAQSIARGAV
ncbi:MAG: NmrA family NAD(P)-binding protein [Myxococcales bacterium]|nr:NmrA family NAD(P)-binding protein [Myxococcales bacterium]